MANSYSIEHCAGTEWTSKPAFLQTRRMMPPRKLIIVVQLRDHGGQYVLTLTCDCGHTRIAHPSKLARFAGWAANLNVVVRRMRCTKCGKRKCSATVRPETKRDG